MFGKGFKIYSILTGCCPKCHQENMYTHHNFLFFWNILKMHNNCSTCKLRYHIEPSFFFGAMFVSYGLSVAVAIATFCVGYFVFKVDLKSTLTSIIVALVVTMPFVLRLSRNIWINIFVDYDKNWKNLSE